MAECTRAAASGSMLVHAAAVADAKAEHSVLIFGEKGAGKTTIAFRLCHQYGFGLVGNDQVFLGVRDGVVVTEGGDDYFNIRQTAATADPYISSLVPEYPRDKPAWNNKVRLDTKDIGVDAVNLTLPVHTIYHVRIDNTQEGLEAKNWAGLQRSLFLHERIGRHVTGQATPFLDDHGNYLGSLPLVEYTHASKNRDRLVRALGTVGITEVFAGNGDLAINYIIQGGAT